MARLFAKSVRAGRAMRRLWSRVHPRVVGILVLSLVIGAWAADPAAAATVSGKVTDVTSTPIAGTEVDFRANDTQQVVASDTADAAGDYAVNVPPATYDVRVTPPAASGFLPQTLPDQVIAGDTELNIVVVPVTEMVNLSGHVVDRDGAPVANQRVSLSAPGSGGSGKTDAQGAYTAQVVPGTYTLYVQPPCYGCGAAPSVPSQYSLAFGTIDLQQDTVRDLTLEQRYLRGTVVDADGLPVASVSVGANFTVAFGGATGSAQDSAQTDAQGHFEVVLFPGTGNLSFYPPQGSGLTSFSVPDVEISNDTTFGILLQFSMESRTCSPFGTGTSCCTDQESDGATPADPVETCVTPPNGGSVTIREVPITQPAPTGFRFLTQQIVITAPAATAGAPLVVTFVLDSSRVPPGETPNTIEMFKNGVRVRACLGAPGTAVPDPCVAARTLLADGDVRFTVLTSTASDWNFGVPTPVSLGAFACYGTKPTKGAAAFTRVPGVGLTDAFTATRSDLMKPLGLCNPAAINGGAASDPATHLAIYALKNGKVCSDDGRACTRDADCTAGATCEKPPKLVPHAGVVVSNLLGELTLTTQKAATLLVSSAQQVGGPPGPRVNPTGDLFRCYGVKLAKGTSLAKDLRVSVQDAFTSPAKLFDVKKATRLCVPVAVDGAAAKTTDTALQCYAVKAAKRQCANTASANAGSACKQEEDCGGRKKETQFCAVQPTHTPVPAVQLGNGFGSLQLDTKKEGEICLPSEVTLP